MTKVKICGITNHEDAEAAVAYGADALGFIFVLESPRYIAPDSALELVRKLPPFVQAVAVQRDVSDYFSCPQGIAIHQYYENARNASFAESDGSVSCRRIKAIRVQGLDDLAAVDFADDPHAVLLDTYNEAVLGGSGETFNWDIAREARERFGKPIILAGGLIPENVGEAIARVRPYAVDVSSGVEAEPKRKDHSKLKAFIDAVHKADSRI